MKWLFSIILIIGFGLSAHAQAQTENRQLMIKQLDIMTWPQETTAAQALDVYIEIMNGDPEAKSFLQQVNEKLNKHGVQHLRDIFSYCPGEPSGNATAFFSQGSKLIGSRISIPGVKGSEWQASALEEQKKAFSSKILKTPFVEFLLISDQPEICIHRGNQLLDGYGSLMHEMAHFLFKNPFENLEDLMSARPLPDFIQSIVSSEGGELDAFKVGTSANIRFLRKYKILGQEMQDHQYFNSEGQLVDEAGLIGHITTIYSDYYKATDAVDQLKNSKQNLIDTRIHVLKSYVEPYVKSLKRVDLLQNLAREIELLESIKADL